MCLKHGPALGKELHWVPGGPGNDLGTDSRPLGVMVRAALMSGRSVP